MNKNKGFTLAEVLITLGIIGVIAALTTPALVQNAYRAKIGPELVNAYNTLENGVQQFMTDYNADYVSVAMKKAGASDTKIETLISSYLFESSIKGAYIKALQLTSATYMPTTSYKWSGQAGGLSGDGTAWILRNRSAIKVESKDCTFSTEDSLCGILVYISGYQKKVVDNKLVTGRDVFKLNISNQGEILPEGQVPGDNWSASGNCDDAGLKAGTASGVGCAGRIATKGWKADY